MKTKYQKFRSVFHLSLSSIIPAASQLSVILRLFIQCLGFEVQEKYQNFSITLNRHSATIAYYIVTISVRYLVFLLIQLMLLLGRILLL